MPIWDKHTIIVTNIPQTPLQSFMKTDTILNICKRFAISLNMNDIQEINANSSWRNILLTICVASAAIYFFFFSHDRSNSISHATSVTTLDKDERQKRRGRLAAIAEERRIAMLKRDDSVQEASSDTVDDKSNNENNQQVLYEVVQLAADGSNSTQGASSKSTDGKDEMTDNTATNTKLGGKEEELVDEKSSNKSTGTNEDEKVDVIVKEESRQRTQQAIAKLKASKKDTKKKEVTEEESSSPKLLTVYLILTSCPSLSKLELTIPDNISTALLLQQVSRTSRIALTDMKLIFRGRIINTAKTVRGKKEKNAVDEYGIVEGCALHIMGKQTLPEVQDSATGVETDPGEVDDETAEEIAFRTARIRREREILLLMNRIRRSTGEALYHRQATRGDLAGLQEAVAAGFSNILRVPDANGWTPLHEAIRAGNTEVIEYLVRDVGLDMTVVTNQGRNALSLAQDYHGREGAVTLLIESLLQESEDSTPPEE